MPTPDDRACSFPDPALLAGFDQVDVGLCLFDGEHRVLACNEAFRTHGGYPEGHCLAGASLADFERLTTKRPEVCDQLISRKCAPLKNGGHMMVSLKPAGDHELTGNKPLTDETESPDARAAAARSGQLESAERLAALGRLTAGVAHEIKNPLNFIVNFAQMSLELIDETVETLRPAMAHLDRDAKADVDDLIELVQQNLVKINQHGRRANSIVRTMLMHARHGEDNTQMASPNTLVEEAMTLARQDLDIDPSARPVKLISSLSSEVGDIECFPEDLVRALFNLIINGVDAARRHQERELATVKVSTRALSDTVEIAVEDNGIGMPDDVLDQAMTPFFTTKPPGEGTGLGLSLSHDVISRQHRGQMAIASQHGMMTRVTLTLFNHLPERRSGGRRRDDG